MSEGKPKQCSDCRHHLPLAEFNKSSKNADGLQSQCRHCLAEYQAKRRRAFNRKMYDYKGGKCNHCGLDERYHQEIYDYHHIDPTEKEGSLSQMASKSWELVKKELDKCLLLCAHCHRKEHARLHYEEAASKRGTRRYI